MENMFKMMIGHIVTLVNGCTPGSSEVRIRTNQGVFVLNHQQDCCETVRVEEVYGEPADLIGGLIVEARVDTNKNNPPEVMDESFLWTFYNIRTTRGDLTIRWLGQSNGWYSEEVNCHYYPNNSQHFNN